MTNLRENANVQTIEHSGFEQLSPRDIRILHVEVDFVLNFLEFAQDKLIVLVAMRMYQGEDFDRFFEAAMFGEPTRRLWEDE
jgi:hypothetical protein